jgi:hypothetical protein
MLKPSRGSVSATEAARELAIIDGDPRLLPLTRGRAHW